MRGDRVNSEEDACREFVAPKLADAGSATTHPAIGKRDRFALERRLTGSV